MFLAVCQDHLRALWKVRVPDPIFGGDSEGLGQGWWLLSALERLSVPRSLGWVLLIDSHHIRWKSFLVTETEFCVSCCPLLHLAYRYFLSFIQKYLLNPGPGRKTCTPHLG